MRPALSSAPRRPIRPGSAGGCIGWPKCSVRAVDPGRFATGSRRYEADSATLSQYRDGTVAELLQDRTPLYIKSYGPGQLASISIRGTSAQHTAVLWNGLNIMLPTLGQNDFALLPVGGQHPPGRAARPGRRPLRQRGHWRGRAPEHRRPTGGPACGAACRPMPAALACAAAAPRRVRPARPWPCAWPPATARPSTTTPTPPRNRRAGAAHAGRGRPAPPVEPGPRVAWRLGPAGQLTAGAWFTDTDREVEPAVSATNRHARQLDQSRRLVLSYRHQARRGRSGWCAPPRLRTC